MSHNETELLDKISSQGQTMTASLIVFAFIWSLFSPGPPLIALNPQTKECGYVSGGDEYASISLPPPWEIQYEYPIKTETGVYEWDGNYESVESLCLQLGYTYVPGNLAKNGQLKWTSIYYILLAFKFAPLIIIFFAVLLFLRWANKRSNNAPIS